MLNEIALGQVKGGSLLLAAASGMLSGATSTKSGSSISGESSAVGHTRELSIE